MYFTLVCPHCSKALKVREELAGKKCRCPYCKSMFIVPEPSGVDLGLEQGPASDPLGLGDLSKSAEQDAGSKAPSKLSPAAQIKTSVSRPKPASDASIAGAGYSSDGSNVSLMTSGLIGLGGAAGLFALLYPLKAADIRLGNMFWDSFGINFPTTWLMFWSFAILFLKSQRLARQKSAMLLDLLPNEISQEITLDSLDKFVSHIHNLPKDARESILVNRVIRGIEHFRVRKSAAETVTMMESQSVIDASNVSGSYTIIKVFIWAMPILGFIGTVMGVSSAVSGLSGALSNASDVSTVTDSMKGVFAGLGTAFNTTLLALIMSLLVKIPSSALQKSEDGLVTIADEYCNENLLRRLNDGREGGAERGSAGADAGFFREAVEAAMGTHHAELEKWVQKLDVIGTKLTKQVAEGWSDINSKMKQQQEKQLANFQEQYSHQVTQLEQRLEEMNAVATGIQQSLSDLTGQAAAIQDGVHNTVTGSTESLQTHFAGIERGLNGLNGVLESLGQQQVVVQQVEPERRGWFGFRKRNGRK